MAIAQVGSVLRFEIGTAASGSQSVVVPAGTDFIVIGLSALDEGAGNRLSGGAYTFTKGGSAVAMSVGAVADTRTDAFQTAVAYLAGPDVGTKTFAWTYAGSGTLEFPALMSVTFWSGVDQASPVRDTKGAQTAGSASSVTTAALTALTGDKIIAFTGFFTSAEGSITTWTNLTELAELTHYTANNADGAWATADPTGNQTIGVATSANFDDGGIVGIVLKAAAAGGGGASSGAIYDLSYENKYWFDDTLFGIGWFDNDWRETVSAGATLVASNLTVTSPALGNPNCICAVATGKTVGSPVLGNPNLICAVATGKTTASPVLGSPNLVNTVAVGETTGSPVLGTPALALTHALTATGITVAPLTLGAPNVVNTVPVGLTVSSPVLGAPTLTQLHGFSAAPGFATGPPVLGAPNVVNTVPAGLTVSSPVLGTPALVATVPLAATALTVSSPALGNPNVVNTVPAGKAVGSPVLGTPSLTNTVALGLTVGSPVLATPRLGYVLVAPAFATGSPVLGNPNCICMVAAALTVSSPVLGAPYWQFTLWLADRVLDLGLNVLDTECSDIFLCSQRPATHAEATATYALGKKVYATGGAFGAPAAGSPGRKVSTPTITGGVVTGAGTALYWAAVDTPNSRLLSTGPLKPGTVAIGQGFDMDAFTIQMFG